MAFKPKDTPLWDIGPCLTYKTTTQSMRDPDKYLKFIDKQSTQRLNFRTYKPRLGKKEEKQKEDMKDNRLISTYQLDYLSFLPDMEEPPPPEPEVNCRYPLPLNVMEFAKTNQTKFLDDPLIFPTPERRQIDRVRQKRHATFLNPKLYESEYDLCCKGKLNKELMVSNNLKEPSRHCDGSRDC